MRVELSVDVALYRLQALFVQVFHQRENGPHNVFVFGQGGLRKRRRRVGLPLALLLGYKLLHLRCGQNVLLEELHLGRRLTLFVCHIRAVQLDKVRHQFYAVLSVVRVLADWVVPEPKHLQIRQLLQVFELTQVANQIFPKIKLLQLRRILKYFELGYVVEGKRTDFEIRDLSQSRDVFELVSP